MVSAQRVCLPIVLVLHMYPHGSDEPQRRLESPVDGKNCIRALVEHDTSQVGEE